MQFNVLRRLDSGGQGTVHEATNVATGESFALKYLKAKPDDPDPDGLVRRFLREIRCQSQLKHPGIVEVVAINVSDSPPWYVMRLAEESLRDRIKRHPGGMPESECVAVLEDLLDAIEYAHAEGITHRDLKPENVLFFGSRAAVSDFGLSRQATSASSTITQTNIGIGTLQYSAPEQLANGHSADARADIYSIGKIFYEMLTGSLPWPTIKSDRVPARFRWIIDHSTTDDPARRYASIEELRADLTVLTSGADQLSSPKDQASACIQEILTGDTRAGVQRLHGLVSDNADDQVFHFDFVVHLPAEVLGMCKVLDADGFARMVRTFCGHCEGQHAFSFTDTLAGFLMRSFRVSDDEALREQLLETMLDLGFRHNRFHVRDLFVELMHEACRSEYGVMQVGKVLRQATAEAVRFVEPATRSQSWPQLIQKELQR